jgi:hypothetical protein
MTHADSPPDIRVRCFPLHSSFSHSIPFLPIQLKPTGTRLEAADSPVRPRLPHQRDPSVAYHIPEGRPGVVVVCILIDSSIRGAQGITSDSR